MFRARTAARRTWSGGRTTGMNAWFSRGRTRILRRQRQRSVPEPLRGRSETPAQVSFAGCCSDCSPDRPIGRQRVCQPTRGEGSRGGRFDPLRPPHERLHSAEPGGPPRLGVDRLDPACRPFRRIVRGEAGGHPAGDRPGSKPRSRHSIASSTSGHARRYSAASAGVAPASIHGVAVSGSPKPLFTHLSATATETPASRHFSAAAAVNRDATTATPGLA